MKKAFLILGVLVGIAWASPYAFSASYSYASQAIGLVKQTIASATPTITPSRTPKPTFLPEWTDTPTRTPTDTPTNTPTSTVTPTWTPRPPITATPEPTATTLASLCSLPHVVCITATPIRTAAP